jgi:hypothetical protein
LLDFEERNFVDLRIRLASVTCGDFCSLYSGPMKKLAILISLASTSIPFSKNSVHAMGYRVPSNYWSCTFLGIEENGVEDKNGILHLELQKINYGSEWFAKKEDAYNAARRECEMYSLKTSCYLAGCSQKSELH